MAKFSLKKISPGTRRFLAFSLFGAIALGSASTTLLFMGSKNAQTDDNGGITDDSNDQIVDPIKNKLFENLTAADMDINDLEINVGGVLNDTSSLKFKFTGGANYLSFMKDYTNAGTVETEDIAAKFGGKVNLLLEDQGLNTTDKTMLKEDLSVYAPGEGTIYLDWNKTGYKVSGRFITNTLSAVTLFLSSEQSKALNEVLEKIQSIDILTLLPMVGTVGGSLVNESSDLLDGGKRYTINVPGSLISPTFESDITLHLDANKNGELINLELLSLSIPASGRKITLSMKTSSIKMHGINSEGTSNIEGYKGGNVISGNQTLEEYYKNDLDSTPNIINTVAKMMNAKTFKFDYELGFNEYKYNEKALIQENKIGEINPNGTHSFEGTLSGDFRTGFDKGNYAFSLDQNASFKNSINVQYQSEQKEEIAKGLFLDISNSLGNKTNAYLSDASINDLFTSINNITKNTEVSDALGTSNEILNDSVIGDIINGNWYKYKEILKKLTITNGVDNTVTLSIQVLLGGLNLNIPFAFESTPVEININYDNSNKFENNYINFIELKNIPLRKVKRIVEQETVTYLDTASLKLNLIESSIGAENITPIKTTELKNYVDYKETIPLFDSIAGVVSAKKFDSDYTLTYQAKNFGNITFNGNIGADLNGARFDTTAAVQDKNYGQYRLTANANINQIAHHVKLDYIPNYKTTDQTLYFDYCSYNEAYRTRLSLDTQTMTSMFDAISTIIANSNGQNSSNETVQGLNQDIFGNITTTLNSVTDFVNGDIWNILKADLPLDKVIIKNTENGYIDITMDMSIFNSSLTDGAVNVILSTKDKKHAAFNININIPNTADSVSFAFNLKDFTSTSVGLTEEETIKYKASDSSVNAILDLVTGNYLDSFKLGGIVSKKRLSPRH